MFMLKTNLGNKAFSFIVLWCDFSESKFQIVITGAGSLMPAPLRFIEVKNENRKIFFIFPKRIGFEASVVRIKR